MRACIGSSNATLQIGSSLAPTRPCPTASLAQAALAGCLPPGVLRQRAAFDRLEESTDGSYVTLHFKGGQAPVTTRLVVGADGCQSAVRQAVIGDGPPLFLGERLPAGCGRSCRMHKSVALLRLPALTACLAHPQL